VLFCYEPYDELVLMQLQQFKGHNVMSVEKEVRQSVDKEDVDSIFNEAIGADSLNKLQTDELVKFLRAELGNKVQNVKPTSKLENHPCMVSVAEMSAARHFMKTQSHALSEENRYALLQPHLEINPK